MDDKKVGGKEVTAGSEAARELSKLGASKGGLARAKSMTAQERSDIARAAVTARWEREGKPAIAQAKYGSPDRPLRMAGGEDDQGNKIVLEIPCYVLEDGRRVLVQRGMLTALAMSQGTAGRTGDDRIGSFVSSKSIKPFVKADLREMIINPIRFRLPTGGTEAYGYEATILADLCDAVLAARKGGKMNYQLEDIAEQCEILVRGFARVGIIALVDEATGYQNERDRNALAKILEAFVAKELRPWIPTFPLDYYKEMYRLRGLQYPPKGKNKMPRYFGKITNDIVYDRLAYGVRDELHRLTPRYASGRLKAHLHRRLTDDIGYPQLKEHLGAVVALMRVTPDGDWDGFVKVLDKYYPRQILLPLYDLPRDRTAKAIAAPPSDIGGSAGD